jgi:hypothetical protein
MSFGKFFAYLVLIVVGVWLGFTLLGWVVKAVLGLAIPIALVAGVGFVGYKIAEKKGLVGSRRRTLP